MDYIDRFYQRKCDTEGRGAQTYCLAGQLYSAATHSYGTRPFIEKYPSAASKELEISFLSML